MDEKNNYLSKKTKRKNDKNMPHYTKEDDIKYNIKNKIIENNKKKSHKSKEKKEIKKAKISKIIREDNEEKEKDNIIDDNNEENEEESKNEKLEKEEEENSVNIDEIMEEEDNNNKNYNLYKKIKKKVIIILEGATLELGSLRKNPKLLNCDEHYKIIKSMKKKLDEFRPDIIHQCLLNLFDSPLNKVGLLQVYLHTNKNILIEINPKTRMPRTFKRFSGLFTQLLLKNEIKASDTNETLMKVINTKIKDLIDKNTPKILLSAKGRLIDIDTYIKNLCTSLDEGKDKDKDKNICFIIGTNPKGEIDSFIKYNDDCISLSSFDLDSNIVCAKICSSFEKVWDIL
jgi:rRNA small subunit pseudouridine methyltransferase Nep1